MSESSDINNDSEQTAGSGDDVYEFNRGIIINFNIPKEPEIEAKSQSKFEKFLASPIGGATITLFFTTIFGGLIANYFSDQQQIQTEYQARITASEKDRKTLIDSFSETLAQRKASAALVMRAILDDAPKKELRERWNQYQQSYMAFQLKIPAFRFDLLETLGASTAKIYSNIVDVDITRSLSRIDDCLTDAYRLRQDGKTDAAKTSLANCSQKIPELREVLSSDKKNLRVVGVKKWKMAEESDYLLGCYATIEIEMMYSIYIENHFDALNNYERDKTYLEIKNKNYIFNQYISIEAMTPEITEKFECAKTTDWACLRLFNRVRVKPKLAAACSRLSDYNYFDLAEPAVSTGPKAPVVL